ncbi:hypothetical protein KPH14_004286 [Odynerus spinipes]|uniref:Uncharacterized protein n=1 Tax=Odynerus spinipes TaxID=1348599 RepID=A0AAD9VV83_9HYME|nr:hypothetical protein KPH14_004286 [Odynerus spinipes]
MKCILVKRYSLGGSLQIRQRRADSRLEEGNWSHFHVAELIKRRFAIPIAFPPCRIRIDRNEINRNYQLPALSPIFRLTFCHWEKGIASAGQRATAKLDTAAGNEEELEKISTLLG